MLRVFPMATAILLVSLPLPSPVHAACPTTIDVNITSGPYLLVDSNKPGVEGPMVATVSAVVSNTGATGTAENIYVYIGNGTTPGSFNMGDDGSTQLALLGGTPDATRYIGNIEAGQSKTVFWQLEYPTTYDVSYPFSVWADNEDGCSATDDGNLQTRSALSARANRMLGTISVDPPSGTVNPGNIVTITMTGFNFGQVGAGPSGEEDAWVQSIGNLDFDPFCFRLVETEVHIHSIENVSPYDGMPVIDQVYFDGIESKNPLPNYDYDANDYIKYYFIALKPCSTTIKPYNEVASGTQEKYSGDYDATATTISVTSESGGLSLYKSVNPVTGDEGDTLTWTITYGNTTDYPIGDPDSGNGLVVIDEGIPADTTYVAGSATCSGDCTIFYSTDDGLTWTATEPAPGDVTKIKWYINDTVPASTDPAGTVSFQTTINSGISSNTTICNTASAHIGEGEALTSSSICVNASSNPVLEVTKTGPSSANVGDAVTYEITVEHADSSDGSSVSDLSVIDSVAGTATYISGDTDTDDQLDDGETWVYEVTYTIENTDPDPLQNTATASGTDGDRETVADEDTHSLDIDYPIVIEVTKADSPDPVEASQTINYTVVINNDGDTATDDNSGNEFEDTIPSNTTYAPGTITVNSAPNDDDTTDGIGYDSTNNKIIWNGSVPAEGSINIAFQVTVDSPLENGTEISNQGIFYWDSNGDGSNNASEPSDDPVTGGDDDPTITTVHSAPVLMITKDDWPEPVKPGETLTYTVTYENTGNEVANNVVITETYDANVTFSSAIPVPDSGTDDTWTIPSLSPSDGPQTITINVTVSSPLDDGTILNNNVSITCDEEVSDGDSEATTISSDPILLLSKADNPDPVQAGGSLTYTLTYQNVGDATATGTVITDVLPEEVTYVTANPSPTSVSDHTLTWSIGNLDPDGPDTITINVTVNSPLDDGTVITDNATITCDQGSGNDAETTTVGMAPILVIEKIDSPDPVEAGVKITYEITVSNYGNADATNVSVVDDYDETKITIVDADGGVDDGYNITWNGGITIPASGSVFFTVVADVALSLEDGTEFENYVSATCAEGVTGTSSILTTVQSAPVVVPPPEQPPGGVAVGGFVGSVDKIALLLPWIGLGGALAAGAVLMVRRRLRW